MRQIDYLLVDLLIFCTQKEPSLLCLYCVFMENPDERGEDLGASFNEYSQTFSKNQKYTDIRHSYVVILLKINYKYE